MKTDTGKKRGVVGEPGEDGTPFVEDYRKAMTCDVINNFLRATDND